MNYTLNSTFVLTALDMGKERGASSLSCASSMMVEVKYDCDKREVVTALQEMISKEDDMSLDWVPKEGRHKVI